jgi:ferritin-like metal-binding protein YciE
MPSGRADIYKFAKPFKKGQSGNPKGRPKLPDLKEAIAKVLANEKDGITALEEILKALYSKAKKGDVRAAQELLDRGFGKSSQYIDHASTDGSMSPRPNIIVHTNEAQDELNKLMDGSK